MYGDQCTCTTHVHVHVVLPASLTTDCVSPMSPLLSNRERSTAPCSLVIMARWARMKREEEKEPRVKTPVSAFAAEKEKRITSHAPFINKI